MSPFAIDRNSYTFCCCFFPVIFKRFFFSSSPISLSLLTFFYHIAYLVWVGVLFSMRQHLLQRGNVATLSINVKMVSILLPYPFRPLQLGLALPLPQSRIVLISYVLNMKDSLKQRFFSSNFHFVKLTPVHHKSIVVYPSYLIFPQPTLLLQSDILFIIIVLTVSSTLSDSCVLLWVKFSKENMSETVLHRRSEIDVGICINSPVKF